jgi:hypothetical protein
VPGPVVLITVSVEKPIEPYPCPATKTVVATSEPSDEIRVRLGAPLIVRGADLVNRASSSSAWYLVIAPRSAIRQELTVVVA